MYKPLFHNQNLVCQSSKLNFIISKKCGEEGGPEIRENKKMKILYL